MKPSRIALISIAAVAVVFAIWYSLRPKPVAVALAKIEKGTVEAVVSNTRAGTVKACRRTRMSPPAGGQIAQLKVKKGERVAAGQVLLELWNNDLSAQKLLAQQQLGKSEILAQQACSQAEMAEHEAARARKLQASGFISPEGLDAKVTGAKTSMDSCNAARSEISQSRSRIEMANAALDRLVLKAPFAGVVADISGELGEYATPSPPGIPTPPAIDLIDDSCLYVSAPIDELDASEVHAGQAGRITLDAIKGKQFAGHVQRVAPYVIDLEKQARTVEVEMTFDQLPDNLLVGYSADVEIVHQSRQNVLRLPTPALLEGKRVLVLADGMLQSRAVSTGLANWEYTEILSGLNEGEQVVLSLDRAGVKAGVAAVPEQGKP